MHRNDTVLFVLHYDLVGRGQILLRSQFNGILVREDLPVNRADFDEIWQRFTVVKSCGDCV